MRDLRRGWEEAKALGWFLVRWTLIGAWVGLMAGAASAAFLAALGWATGTRERMPLLLLGLPVAGALIGLAYGRFGKEAAGGNNLILDRIHEPGETIPFRMAPMILLTTVATHLFGGSAGREGTAVQMGGTLADLVTAPLRISGHDRRILLMAGISGGFGAVFGTPLAGAVFGLEVLTLGRLRYDALVPCLVASVVGDVACRWLGITHHRYDAPATFAMTPVTMGWVLLAGALFALAAVAFVELTHWIAGVGKDVRGAEWVRPLVGGIVVVALTYAVGTYVYNGLSLPLLGAAFHSGIPLYAFALKILFTAITLGAGFKGGEVTPLFVIGATLGNAFAVVTGQDPALFAALGFVAVFAGAANTPLACVIMGMELFGAHLAVPLAFACVGAYLLSGHRGIYVAQRVHLPEEGPVSLRDLRK
jgi:H+/Cl- antiporter ClcA